MEEDGLIFEPTQVIKSNAFGYVVPHGDHYHIIPRSQLSPLEMELADRYLAGQTEDNDSGSEHSKPSDKEVTHTFLGHRIKAYGKGLDGKPYDTVMLMFLVKNPFIQWINQELQLNTEIISTI